MKKILYVILILNLFTACGSKLKLETSPVTERNVKLSIEDKEEKDYPIITITDDDGMIYIDKENFRKIVENLPDLEYVKSDEDKVVFNGEGYKVEVDFKEKKLKKEFLGYESLYEELRKENLEESNESIRREDIEILIKYFEYEKNFVKEKEEIALNSLKEGEVLLYDILSTLELNMSKDSKKVKILSVSSSTFDGIYMSRKTNEYSFELLREDIYNLVKLGLVEEDKIKYLDKNREKFIENFYKEIYEFSSIMDRGHFEVARLEKLGNDVYAMKVGETKISDEGNSIIKIIDDETAYLKISTFSPNHYNDKSTFLFKEFEEDMEIVSGYKNLIIDVRNNFGGQVVSVMYLVSLLTNKEVYEYHKEIEENRKLLLTDLSPKKYDGNLVVLANRGSASGGTIFPAIIKTNHLGVVIGEKTEGQTDPIIIKNLPNGMTVTSSTLTLYTDENYNSIDGGMTPDILIEDAATIKDRDPILTRALEYLDESK